MCGSTAEQNNTSTEQQGMYSKLNGAYSTAFGQNQSILGSLTSSFSPLLAAGPNQQGYSQGEMTARNSNAAETTAASYGNAQTATAEQLAARGGGNNVLGSGVDAQLTAQNNVNAASQLAGLKNQNMVDSYNQGRSNYWNAASGLGGVASDLNPNSYAGTATNAGQAAASQENTIEQANMSPWTTAIGAATSLGGAALAM